MWYNDGLLVLVMLPFMARIGHPLGFTFTRRAAEGTEGAINEVHILSISPAK
jgi:hypothetical protein